MQGLAGVLEKCEARRAGSLVEWNILPVWDTDGGGLKERSMCDFKD